MTTTNNITTSTVNMNIHNNTDQTINPNMYIPTKACNRCRIIKQLTEFNKQKRNKDGYLDQCKNCINNRIKEHYELIKDEIYHDISKNKTCNKCNQIKCVTEFHKDRKSNDGYKNQCINCRSNYQKEYSKENKDKFVENTKQYYEANKEKILSNSKKYYEINKDKMLKYSKEYKEINKDRINNTKRAWDKNQRNINPIYRLITNNRRRIRSALESNSKTAHTIYLLGCDRFIFYQWIQFQLPFEMSDDEFKKLYDIDHVKPIASFDLSIEQNQFEAFVWTNCCPLLKHKNRSKGAKRNLWLEVLQEIKAIVFLKLYYPEFCSSNVEES